MERLIAIGEHVRRKQRRRHGQTRAHELRQPVEIIALKGRNRDDSRGRHALRHVLDERQQLILRHDAVHLVDHEKERLFQTPHPLPNPDVLLGEAHGLDHEQDHVGVLGRGDGDAVHVLVHDAPGAFMQSGRIDQHELRLGAVDHAQDAVPGGLRLGGDDAHLAADERVHQRGLAHVGTAHDGHHACAKAGRAHEEEPRTAAGRSSSALCAAACSARRRLTPSPQAVNPNAGTSQVTANDWACASPVVERRL